MMQDSKILIVDEAQRLNEEEIEIIIDENKSNINVFLGDNLQKLNKLHDKGIDLIECKIKKNDLDYKKYYFNHSIGLSNNILYSIKYLIFNSIPFRNQNINNYDISIFNDSSKFVYKYNKDPLYRKHMATIYMGVRDYNVTIEGFERWHKNKLSL